MTYEFKSPLYVPIDTLAFQILKIRDKEIVLMGEQHVGVSHINSLILIKEIWSIYHALMVGDTEWAERAKDRCLQYILTRETDGVTDWILEKTWSINPYALDKNDFNGIFEYVFLMICSGVGVTLLLEGAERTHYHLLAPDQDWSGLMLLRELFKACNHSNSKNKCSKVFPNVIYKPTDLRPDIIGEYWMGYRWLIPKYEEIDDSKCMLTDILFPILNDKPHQDPQNYTERIVLDMSLAMKPIWDRSKFKNNDRFIGIFTDIYQWYIDSTESLDWFNVATIINVINELLLIYEALNSDSSDIIVSVGGALHQITIEKFIREYEIMG